jgi:hypothetical protein
MGIDVFSSKATLRGNECWKNGHSGISIERDDKSTSDPSEAELADNRCHDNTEAGVAVFSSKAYLCGNKCWENAASGIHIQRHLKSKNDPSDTELSNNLCHHNAFDGVLVRSSKALMSGNESWSNGRLGIGLERQDGLLASKTNDPLVEFGSNFLRDNGVGGVGVPKGFRSPAGIGANLPSLTDLAAKLASQGLEAALALAGFLTSSCRGCFEGFWAWAAASNPNLLSRGAERAAAGESDADSESTWAYEVKLKQKEADKAAGKVQVTARPLQARAPEDVMAGQLAELFTGLYVGQKSPVRWLGLVTPNESAAKKKLDGAFRKAKGSLQRAGRTDHESRPHFVDIDYSRRNDYGVSDESLQPLFWSERLGSPRQRFRQRLGYLATLPAVWFVLAALAALAIVAVTPPLAHSIRSPAAHFVGSIRWLDWRTWLGAFGVIVATFYVVVLAIRLIDSFILPKPLNLFGASAAAVWSTSYAVLTLEYLKPLIELFERRSGAQAKATRRWLRQGFYGPPRSMTCLVLRNVESWRDERKHSDAGPRPAERAVLNDIEALLALLDPVPPDRLVCVVIQMDDRSFVQPALVDFMRSVGRASGDGVTLILDDEDTGPATPAEVDGDAEPDLDGLLGLTRASADRRAEFRQTLRHEAWHLFDTLPTLPLASAPTARFWLHLPVTVASLGLPDVEFEVGPYRAIFSAWRQVGRTPPAIQPQDLEDFKNYARFAKTIQYNEIRYGPTGRREGIRVDGRLGERARLIEELRRIWLGDAHDPADARDAATYICAAIACGEWRLLDDLRRLLALDLSDPRVARRLLSGFKALRTLAGERIALDATPRLPAALAAPWRAVVEAMQSPLPAGLPDVGDRRLRDVLVGCFSEFLAAAHLYGPTDEQTEPLLSAVQRDVAARLDPSVDLPQSLQDVFIDAFTGIIRRGRLMEARLAASTIARLKRREWAALPEPLVEMASQAILSLAPPSLPEALLQARDAAEIEATIALHHGQVMRLLYLLSALAASHVRRDPNLIGEAKDEALVSIGLRLSRICAKAPPPEDGEYFSSDDFNGDLSVLARPKAGAETLANYVRDSRAEQMIPHLLAQETDSSVIPGVLDNELERVLIVSESVVGMRYGERRYEILQLSDAA